MASAVAALPAQPRVRLLHHSPAGCIVVHKPAGVPFHAVPEDATTSTEARPGLMQLIRSQQGSEHLPYTGALWPVHRLDMISSGCLVLATRQEAAGELIAAFRQRQVHKYYVALSQRHPSRKMGSVVGEMERGRRGSWMLARRAAQPADGTQAPPGYKAVTRFTSTAVPGRRPGLRAFLLKPETGRTHQLRVAMKSLGAPALGDERYAQKDAAAREDRAYLHCAALRFVLGGEAVQVVCPPKEGVEFAESPEFRAAFDSWLPPSLEQELGPWFSDSKLLRSSLQIAA